jgi:hypothetical protein
MNHCSPLLLKTVDGYRKKLPMPMTPLKDARMNAVRDGH